VIRSEPVFQSDRLGRGEVSLREKKCEDLKKKIMKQTRKKRRRASRRQGRNGGAGREVESASRSRGWRFPRVGGIGGQESAHLEAE